ncbi:MAG: hypothetical protein WD824_08040 [Cyclobacteriaceae bacterium]
MAQSMGFGILGTCYFMTQEYDKSKKALGECIDLNATKNATQYAQKRIVLFGHDDFYRNGKLLKNLMWFRFIGANEQSVTQFYPRYILDDFDYLIFIKDLKHITYVNPWAEN